MKANRHKADLTEKITYAALLVALQVVLGSMLQIPLLSKQFNFGFLPIAVAGVFLGWPWAVAVGALGDFLGAHLFPAGPYYFGFTLTAMGVGLVYGLVLAHKPANWVRIGAACLLVAAWNLLLNSYWLSVAFIPKGYWVIVAGRIWTYLIDVPVAIVTIYFVVKGLCKLNRPPFQMEAKE